MEKLGKIYNIRFVYNFFQNIIKTKMKIFIKKNLDRL
jgi:hypothetical protein